VDSSAAPGELEQVRSFLNTHWIPNDTRQPVDDLADLAADEERWATSLPGIPPPKRAEVSRLSVLRDQLRDALGRPHPTALQAVVDTHRWHVELTPPGRQAPVRLVPDRLTTASAILAIVVDAVATGRWYRLRACPDCGWVFYDSSRNARRTWCSMTAAGGARGCGSIAKTRAYRARHAAGR
jgi:predicted RNA-binding Zn ribbon-like protein